MGLVLLLLDDLGSQVLQGSARRAQLALEDRRTVLEELAQAEVHELNVIVLVHQNVLRFDITMGDSSLLQVLDRLAELLEVFTGFVLRAFAGVYVVVPRRTYAIHEVHAIDQLHHQVQ